MLETLKHPTDGTASFAYQKDVQPIFFVRAQATNTHPSLALTLKADPLPNLLGGLVTNR